MNTKTETKMSGVIAILIATVLLSVFYNSILINEIRDAEKVSIQNDFNLNQLQLSNQELRESKEQYINYFNTNGMYSDFYGGLIVLNI